MLLAIAALSCRGRAAGTGGALARVRAAGVLRWGGDIQGGEPYVYEDGEHGGRLTGFEVELAGALARELGVRAQFVQNDWSALIPTLERGTFDVALNGVEVTPQRVGRVRFTRPYYVFGARLMARRDDPRIEATLASLRGRRVGTLSNSFSAELLRGVAEIVPYEGVEEPYIDLVQRRTDAVVLDDIIATRYGEPKPELRVVGDLADGYYAIAVRPADDDLRLALDAALARITARGELERILRGGNIWNDRQRRLAAWSDDDQRRMLGTAAAGQRFGWTHLALFARGALVTLWLSALAMCVAIPLGLGLAVARLYGPTALSRVAGAYVELYRGTPVLLQLYVLYYGLAPVLNLDARVAAVLGLGMNYAAYEAEVYRGAILAIPRGQAEAAKALGLSPVQSLRHVIVPQALRLALPPMTNDFVSLLKDSSLVSVITVIELTKQMTISSAELQGWLIPGLACAGMYLALSVPLSELARRLERRLARDQRAHAL